MADYLQPGGARIKLSKEEKQALLFKVKNLSKSVISQCLIDSLASIIDPSVVIVFLCDFHEPSTSEINKPDGSVVGNEGARI